MSDVIACAPQGELYLQPAKGPAIHILVSKDVLCNASEVWKGRLVSETCREAQELEEAISGGRIYTLTVADDEPSALIDWCRVLHGDDEDALSLTLNDLYQVVVLADKYQCVDNIRGLLEPALQEQAQSIVEGLVPGNAATSGETNMAARHEFDQPLSVSTALLPSPQATMNDTDSLPLDVYKLCHMIKILNDAATFQALARGLVLEYKGSIEDLLSVVSHDSVSESFVNNALAKIQELRSATWAVLKRQLGEILGEWLESDTGREPITGADGPPYKGEVDEFTFKRKGIPGRVEYVRNKGCPVMAGKLKAWMTIYTRDIGFPEIKPGMSLEHVLTKFHEACVEADKHVGYLVRDETGRDDWPHYQTCPGCEIELLDRAEELSTSVRERASRICFYCVTPSREHGQVQCPLGQDHPTDGNS